MPKKQETIYTVWINAADDTGFWAEENGRLMGIYKNEIEKIAKKYNPENVEYVWRVVTDWNFGGNNVIYIEITYEDSDLFDDIPHQDGPPYRP